MQRMLERILNLLAFLLTVERPVTADEIRHTVAGYDQGADEAFRRTFERDKDLLRSLGIPLRLQATDGWEVEHGYVVSQEEYALADPGLTDEERAALWLAAQTVRLGGQGPGPAAIFKLGGAPVSAEGEPLAANLGSDPERLAALFAAVTSRQEISFRYRDRRRRVRPYGLAHRMGHWYLVGPQVEGGGVRSFRVDRIESPETHPPPDAFRRPPGFRVGEVLPEAPWEAGEEELRVTVRFDPQVAWWARRHLTERAEVTESANGGLEAVIPVASVEAFLGWMIGFEEGAEILEPAETRRRMIEQLQAAR